MRIRHLLNKKLRERLGQYDLAISQLQQHLHQLTMEHDRFRCACHVSWIDPDHMPDEQAYRDRRRQLEASLTRADADRFELEEGGSTPHLNALQRLPRVTRRKLTALSKRCKWLFYAY